MLNSNERRIDWIDECKGLAIILVVFGHCWSKEISVFQWINSFHLTIFFIIAGYLMINKNTGFSKEIVMKKIRRLLIPYFIFSFLLLLVLSILKMLGGMTVSTLIIEETKAILGFRANMSTWFLACIFMSESICLIILKITKGKIYLHIFFDLLCIATVFCIDISAGGIFVLRRTLLGVLWREIGQLFFVFHKKDYSLSWSMIAVVFISSIILSAYNENVNVMVMNFGKNKMTFFVIGVLSSITIMELFRKCNKRNQMLIYYGTHSMEILCTHTFIIEGVRLIDYKLLGGLISNKINFEGYILTAIVLLLEIPVIWILNTYFPWSIGKQSKQIRLNN